jgi:hypothetical protein
VGYLGENGELKKFKKWPLYFCLTLTLVTPIIPSKQAIYLMAGAEIAKEVIQSDTAKKVKLLVDKELDHLLEKVK